MKLTQKELLELFSLSIDNALQLFNAAQHLATSFDGKKYPSLGLAELALEELGKSYTCLAYYSKANEITDWAIFWKEWKNHELKAHRAFFYEFFCVQRIELKSPKFHDNFPSLRGRFSKEKEISFYVDIDKTNRLIHNPEIEISDDECLNRLVSLIGLFNVTFHIREWLESENSPNFKNAISDYAFVTISTEMYQQDVENVLNKLRTDNHEYNNGLETIRSLFKPNSSVGKGLSKILTIINQENLKKKK